MPNIDQVQLPNGSQYNLKDNTSGYVTAGYVDSVISGLTKDNVGLGNVDNTSDLNKPVSTAQQTALNGKTNTTVIAPTEATTTASRRYEIGEQFILNGVLYTATAIIASGDSIIVDTNCELSENITEQIDEKAEKTDFTSIIQTGSTASQAISIGTYFYLNGTLVRAKTAIANGATFTLNTNYEVITNGGLNNLGVEVSSGITTSHTIATLSAYKIGNIVFLQGALTGTVPNNATVLTLPSNILPKQEITFTACTARINNAITEASLLVKTDGTCRSGYAVNTSATVFKFCGFYMV